MFAAMAIGPLARIVGMRNHWMQWMMKRRWIGVAAFVIMPAASGALYRR